MPFNSNQILVFDRSGARIGVLNTWAQTVARTFRINEVEDWAFNVPQLDPDGNLVLSDATVALLARDNLIYVENDIDGIPGWGGSISDVTFEGGYAAVSCLSGVALLGDLETTRIEQSGGQAGNVASRLVASANAKQGAHGDVVMQMAVDGSNPIYGVYNYEGDILQGLQQLATDSVSEFWVESILGSGGLTLGFKLHWDTKIVVDQTATVITDGVGGNVAPGTQLKYSALEVLNRARLKGSTTNLAKWLDYDCVKGVIQDITPEVELVLEGASNFRRRENLNLTVNFSFSDADQKAMAQTIQAKYLEYYKSFLYALHNRGGKPFLEGFDWGGPDSANENHLTERYYRTLNKLGRIGEATIIVAGSDNGSIDAQIDSWTLDLDFAPAAFATGIALDYSDLSSHWLADGATGMVSELGPDYVTETDWQVVTGSGESLKSIATSPADINTLWVLVTDASNSTVRSYDIDSKAVLSSWSIPGTTNNDIAIDAANGIIYIVGNDGVGKVQIRDISNGSLLSPDISFASGFTNPVGISISGGLAYVVDSTGNIRMLYSDQTSNIGHLAGTFSTGLSCAGIFVDLQNRRIWIIRSDGAIAVYHAYIAVGSINAPGSVDGAPGFNEILNGQFVHIVMTTDSAFSPPAKKVAPASGTTHTVVHGDTLWGLAEKYYGNGSQWPTICNYNLANIKATASSHGFTSDFCHWIFPGEVLTIPGVGGKVTPPLPVTPATVQYLIVYQQGFWDTQIQPGPINQPDQLSKTWVQSGDQIIGVTTADKCIIQDPKVVIYGEEGRVCDWNPTRDGYGLYKTSQLYKTRTGLQIDPGAGWYPSDWDVPSSDFTPDQPIWTDGLSHLQLVLAQRNREISVHTIHVVNQNNLWGKVSRGALFTINATLQGPPTGISGQLRVIAFSPNEYTGLMEIIGEWL